MRVLWPHNFSPARHSAGVFMFAAADALREAGVDVELEYLGNLRSPLQLLRAARTAQRMSSAFDIVHAQYGSACALAASGVRNRPKVVTIRGNDWNLHSMDHDGAWWHTRLARFMTRRALPRFQTVLVPSNRMAREIGSEIRGLDVQRLPSPVDLSRFVPRNRAEVRAALGSPGDERPWILFTAAQLHESRKRFGLARSAVELARAQGLACELKVATGIPHAELPALVAACDLILCTSETEGWPNSVKEALACNVPFVATDVSDLREIAAIDPHCRVCPPEAGALAAALRDVIALGPSDGLRAHVKEMERSAITSRLIGIYEGVLKGWAADGRRVQFAGAAG